MAWHWHRSAVLLFACVPCLESKEKKKKATKVEFFQNCAARGLCDNTWEIRDKKIHDAPPETPKGHLKPLGHPDFLDSWLGEVDIYQESEPPDPEKFWKEYSHKRQPLILKGAAFNSPALNWTDRYIMENFGDEVAKVEWRNEDRLTDYCGQKVKGKYIHCPKDTIPYVESRTSIRTFIKQSTADPDWAKYIISQMPDGMGKEWNVPGFFNCGKRHKGNVMKDKPWMTQLYENNFWYLRLPPGKIGTSTIHYDMNHQLMCVFAGKKEWIVWDMQTERKHIPMWNQYYRTPDKGGPKGSDDSPIDGERVDLIRWPDFAKAKWKNTTIEKGDCLFMPANYLHYVRSWTDDPEDPRCYALMTMYGHEDNDFDPTYCKDIPAYTPLSEYDVMWGEFPGSDAVPLCQNHIKMGYDNWKKVLEELANREANEKQFMSFWKGRGEDGRYPKKRIKQAWARFVGENNKGSWAERIFNSTAVAQLAKDVSCFNNGSRGPQRKLKDGESWDARNEYSLAAGQGTKQGYTDETHTEL